MDKIKQQVAELASFSLGKQRALNLHPSDEYQEVEARQELTTQAVALLWKQGTPPLAARLISPPSSNGLELAESWTAKNCSSLLVF